MQEDQNKTAHDVKPVERTRGLQLKRARDH